VVIEEETEPDVVEDQVHPVSETHRLLHRFPAQQKHRGAKLRLLISASFATFWQKLGVLLKINPLIAVF
jgi:hypothetical protein